jgi:uncharacterized protein
MVIPGEETCIDLLHKYETPPHIIAHSLKVWDVGRILGNGLIESRYPINMPLLAASCLLHDIGKYPCIVDGSGYHDVRGEQILESEGYSEVGNIIVQHVILRTPEDAPIAEEHVLFYADKRVVHDEVVSLEERFVYLEETYGKTTEALKRLQFMKYETMRLERAIFTLLEFLPDDLLDLLSRH